MAELGHRARVALDFDEDRRGVVADESGQIQFCRDPMHERAESDALHDPGDGEAPPLRGCGGGRRWCVDHRRRQMMILLLPESATARRSPRSHTP